ncbi:MAG: cytochrome-c oxidase, cbb3-type subunit III [Steroidobacteraceae bacterium]
MSSLSHGFSIWVTVLVLGNIIGAMWLLWWTRRPHDAEKGPAAETTGHVWDGDLAELNNPLPRWWLWLFILSTIFALGYLLLYPGLGNYKGLLGWTSAGQHAAEAKAAEIQSQQLLGQFADKSVPELIGDPQARAIGRNLFANNCTVCHGADGRGNTGFPNLTDNDWLWGGSAEDVVTTITGGRGGVMPAWGPVLGASGVDDVLAYVLTLSGHTLATGDAAHGKEVFASLCAACHGPEGKGNQLLGAPNLTDQIWLYGGSPEAIRHSIAEGRNGVMPAQGERLGPTRVKLLAAYVLGLNESAAAH